jgi:hypothetical protein
MQPGGQLSAPPAISPPPPLGLQASQPGRLDASCLHPLPYQRQPRLPLPPGGDAAVINAVEGAIAPPPLWAEFQPSQPFPSLPLLLADPCPLPSHAPSPPYPPEIAPPPAKRTRKQRNEVELLQVSELDCELLLSPPTCPATPPSRVPPPSSP